MHSRASFPLDVRSSVESTPRERGRKMTTAFVQNPTPGNMPSPPRGWPIGSYETYEEAQRAVDYLADKDFPVGDVTIVGGEPMLVERVAARLTGGGVIGRGAASGAWVGLAGGVVPAGFPPGAGFGPVLI